MENNTDYLNRPSIIPIYFNGEIIATVPFEPNLNLIGRPSYVNESCNMGLTRLRKGQFKNRLVIMYENDFYPSQNRGELISENDAYEMCMNRGKNDLIKKYQISPKY